MFEKCNTCFGEGVIVGIDETGSAPGCAACWATGRMGGGASPERVAVGMARRAYEAQSPQLELGGVAPVTNEGVGDEHDFYPTPAWVTQAILPHLPWFSNVLDPCAGDGAMLKAVAGFKVRGELTYGDLCNVGLRGIEIDPARAAASHLIVQGNALTSAWGPFDLAILNPPFSLAEEFVRRALLFAVPQRATVAALLRLAFLESAGRISLHRGHPSDVYVFAHRPSFIDPDAFRPCPRCKGGTAPRAGETTCVRCKGKTQIKGGSDSTAYAWFVWGPGRGGRWQVLDAVNPDRKGRVARPSPNLLELVRGADRAVRQAEATNPRGERVSGVVCCGLLKGCTVRF